MDRQLNLKIKLGSLAAEIRLIRRAQRAKLRHARRATAVRDANAEMPASEFANFTDYADAHRQTWADLNSHRKFLRGKARESYLAYGFIRGVARRRIEENPRKFASQEAVEEIVRRFWPGEYGVTVREAFGRWWKTDDRPLRGPNPKRPPYKRVTVDDKANSLAVLGGYSKVGWHQEPNQAPVLVVYDEPTPEKPIPDYWQGLKVERPK